MSAKEQPAEAATTSARGLKGGALGFVASTGMGIASTAPAYSLAATLGFVVATVGPQTLLLVPLAFIPMFFSAWANKEMNRADPDCGSSFTWAARALGPKTGWYAGGWGTIASDLLAMASQSQIAGQYFFLLIGAKSIGVNATSPWVLTVGIAWIVILTYICYRGIQVSARLQVTLLAVEIFMLLLLAVVAIVRVGLGRAPAGHAAFSWSWLNPAHFASPSVFMAGMLLMVFIYWGWDTTTSINEETADPRRIPGLAGVVSTLILLGTYFVVILSVQLFAGFGSSGIGLKNSNNVNDVLSPMGEAVFGGGAVGQVLSRLLLLMVLTSAAATTQTTILPTARTTLSMSFHKALPAIFGRVHPRYLTPWFSTIVFSVASAVMYVALNFVSGGNVLADSVTAATFFVALYLGSTGFACFWFYRKSLRASAANFWLRGVIPLLSGIMLLVIGGWAIYFYTDPNQSYSTWQMPFWPHWTIGGVLSIGIITALVGLAWMLSLRRSQREFFSGASMRDGYSITDDDTVVRVSAPADVPAGASTRPARQKRRRAQRCCVAQRAPASAVAFCRSRYRCPVRPENDRKIYTYAVATAMPVDPPGDPPQLEDLLGEPWRAQVTALRRYVRKTRDVRVAELLSLAFEAAVGGDADAAGRHIAAAGALLGTESPAGTRPRRRGHRGAAPPRRPAPPGAARWRNRARPPRSSAGR